MYNITMFIAIQDRPVAICPTAMSYHALNMPWTTTISNHQLQRWLLDLSRLAN